MKKLLLMFLSLVLALTAVGCGEPSEDDPDFLSVQDLITMAKNNTAGGSGSDEIEVTGTPNFTVPTGGYDGSDVTITFYHTMGKNLSDVLKIYIEEFNKMYPNIHVVHEQVGGYDDVKSRISMELTTGKGPSLAYCYPDHVAMYNLANAVATLDNLIDSTESDGNGGSLGLSKDQKADFIQGYYNEGRQFGDGLMYSMPFSKSTEVLYYNKTFFDENGIEVPTHWFSESEDDVTSLEAVCEQILAIDPLCIPLGYDSEANLFITMCEQLGSDYTTAVGDEKFLFNNDANKTFCKEFRRWFDLGYMTTQELLGSYTSNLFVSQDELNSYMSIGSSAGATHQRPAKIDGEYPFEVGIASIPQMNPENPKVISQGPSICVFKKSNPQEVIASWLFVKFLTTDVNFQAEFSKASGYVPVLKSVLNNPEYDKWIDSANGGNDIAALSAKVCLEQENAYYTSPAFSGSSKARDEVGLLLTKILSNSTNTPNAMINKSFADAVNNCKFYS